MQTLGEKLRNARLEKEHSLIEISNKLAIPVTVLDAMEQGRHTQLPALCFSQGFIKSYGEFLGLDTKPLIHLHKQETHEFLNRNGNTRPVSRKITTKKGIEFPFKIFMQSELVTWAAIIAIIMVSWFGYASFVGSKNIDQKKDVQASTTDLRLEKMKAAPNIGYRSNRDPAAIDTGTE
ncbi:MAG: hypothetical protein COA73_08010 [Candidatus Hydrogenedentota bacterium]|nr:MAG: hypothetical protein COA73_08010 [Candidatus Hydrogenedentota bacterium]